MPQNCKPQKGGTFASDDLCHTVGQRGFDNVAAMQTNKFMSGGDAQIPSLVLPDGKDVAYAPVHMSAEPSQIIPVGLTQNAIYPMYYSTNYAPLLQVGSGNKKHKGGNVKGGRWRNVPSPRPRL